MYDTLLGVDGLDLGRLLVDLGLDASLSPLPGSLGACASGLLGVGNVLGTGLLRLGLVDVLDEGTLVLEGVTLGRGVERVVEVVGDLARVSVLSEQATEDALTTHPLDGRSETSLRGTVTLTGTAVSAESLGGLHLPHAGPAVDDGWLLDDEAILDELADVLARVGVGNLRLLVRVEPDLSLADLEDGRCQSLLRLEVRRSSHCC